MTPLCFTVESTEATEAVPGRALAFLGVTAVPRPILEAGRREKDKGGGAGGRGGELKRDRGRHGLSQGRGNEQLRIAGKMEGDKDEKKKEMMKRSCGVDGKGAYDER
jgi:hypothetical protein